MSKIKLKLVGKYLHLCLGTYLVFYAPKLEISKIATVFYRGEHVITFDTPTTEAQEWDLYQRGPRIFLFRQESFYFVV